MSASAPIVLFAYNRPRHLRQALDALAANEGAQDSELLAFCDGPRPSAEPGELRRIEEVRAIVRQERRFARVAVVEREGNLGLARSVIEGVTTALSRHDRVIVVEDDIVSSRGFLRYMNAALAMYADDDRVGCIHAWNFHVDTSGCPDTTFFLKGADCWGWGTWRRGWREFREDGHALLAEIDTRGLEHAFDRRGTFPFTAMLRDQVAGRIDSWAIRWHASLFLADKYCLHPTRPIVRNIGVDASGVHGALDIRQDVVESIDLARVPVREAEWFFAAYATASAAPGARLRAALKRLLRRSV